MEFTEGVVAREYEEQSEGALLGDAGSESVGVVEVVDDSFEFRSRTSNSHLRIRAGLGYINEQACAIGATPDERPLTRPPYVR